MTDTLAAVLRAGRATAEQALEIFDRLEPAQAEFMLGAWRGEGFWTGHPLDGWLEACRWHGKRFESAEDVHPLVFQRLGGGTMSVTPVMGLTVAARLAERLPFLKSRATGRVVQALLALLSTRRSRARLRMVTYRGKSSATMLYDHVPINDVFRKIDADTVLGLMDMKGMQQPFFFLLRRE